MQAKQAILKLQKQKKTHLRNCYNIRSDKMYSLVHPEKEKALVNSASQRDLDIHKRQRTDRQTDRQTDFIDPKLGNYGVAAALHRHNNYTMK